MGTVTSSMKSGSRARVTVAQQVTAEIGKDEVPLVLGWHVTKGLDPKYWVTAGAKPGQHDPDEDVVSVSTPLIARHMVVVAQSGSGKSFFLGRLIEEILIKSKSRVVIFDPNSDFRKVAIPKSNTSWENAAYDVKTRRGFLPDEESAKAFEREWDKISKVVLSARVGYTELDRNGKIELLAIDWTGISTEVLSGELEPVLEHELRHCHAFVRTVSKLIALTKPDGWTVEAPDNNLIDVAKQLCEGSRGRPDKVIEALKKEFPFTSARAREADTPVRTHVQQLYKQAAVDREFINESMEKFYFGNAIDIRAANLLRQSNVSLADQPRPRLQVIDLPSISDQRFRPWVVSTLLATEWLRASREWEKALDASQGSDRRVPTFIVVDEAHNLIPAEPRSHSERGLREQFRTIAAEGRKFGLFLILISQRPDKLDPLIVSECENRAVMKIGSAAVLAKTRELLGLGDVPERTLERCLEFDLGRALLAGAWVRDDPVILYGAARRTLEGGGNLDEKFWARPE